MTIKYIYVDDDPSSSTDLLVSSVIRDKSAIDIVRMLPLRFEDQLDYFEATNNNYDGIILDWRLDQLASSKQDKPVAYRAAALAQQLRTSAGSSSKFKEVPIILWSILDRMKRTGYLHDSTSHDLFDRTHLKEDVAEKGNIIRGELISLASGYQAIVRARDVQSDGLPTLSRILQVSKDAFGNMNPDFTGNFSGSGKVPAHVYARFILEETILRPGILLSEALLAARLGVDTKSEDWDRLLRKLEMSKYRGPFGEAWPRWWAQEIEVSWWHKTLEIEFPLTVLSADQRVDLLRKKTRLKGLKPAAPIEATYSNQFQTICEFYQQALDPVDGVIIDEPIPHSWQRRRFLSVKAALQDLGKDHVPPIRPHPSEKQRLQRLKRLR